VLKIHRKKEYRDRMRNYQIIVDNELLGTLKGGETKEINVDPGKHSLKLTIDWCSSPELTFDIKEGETIEFNCRNAMKSWRILFPLIYISFLKNRYIHLYRKIE